jgi:hypothetical protein
MRGQAVSNHRRRKDKESESSIDSTVSNQTLKQQKQVNERNHHIPININTECQCTQLLHERHHLANWIKREYPTICCLQETHLIDRNKHWLREKGWKKIYQVNDPRKQVGVAILILNKVDFKFTLIKQD